VPTGINSPLHPPFTAPLIEGDFSKYKINKEAGAVQDLENPFCASLFVYFRD